MDIVAHTLWAAAGVMALHRRWPLSRRTVSATLAMAALPDVLHLLPVAGWWLFTDGTFAALRSMAFAVPGQEPGLPPLVQVLSHNLHCVMHSAPVAAVVTGAVWAGRRTFWIPLLGWWSHIVIDVFTHSADYYAVPVLYPFTQRGFDGIAWTTPWFQAVNYVALAIAGVWLVLGRRGRRGRRDGRAHLAMVFGYKEKPNFTVDNEKDIARPPTVDFGAAPARAGGAASGAAR